jgi:hypothetical protein
MQGEEIAGRPWPAAPAGEDARDYSRFSATRHQWPSPLVTDFMVGLRDAHRQGRP